MAAAATGSSPDVLAELARLFARVDSRSAPPEDAPAAADASSGARPSSDDPSLTAGFVVAGYFVPHVDAALTFMRVWRASLKPDSLRSLRLTAHPLMVASQLPTGIIVSFTKARVINIEEEVPCETGRAGAALVARRAVHFAAGHPAPLIGVALLHMLVERLGVDIAVPDGNLDLPIHIAAMANNAGAVRLLLDRGADECAPNAAGLSASELVSAYGSPALKKVLEVAACEREKKRLHAIGLKRQAEREEFARIRGQRLKREARDAEVAKAVSPRVKGPLPTPPADDSSSPVEGSDEVSTLASLPPDECLPKVREAIDGLRALAARHGAFERIPSADEVEPAPSSSPESGRAASGAPSGRAAESDLAPAAAEPSPGAEEPSSSASGRLDPGELLEVPWEIDLTRGVLEAWDLLPSAPKKALFRKLVELARGENWGGAGLRLIPPAPGGDASASASAAALAPLYDLWIGRECRVVIERPVAFSLRFGGFTDVIRVWALLAPHQERDGGGAALIAAIRAAQARGRGARGRQALYTYAPDVPPLSTPHLLPRRYIQMQATAAEGASLTEQLLAAGGDGGGGDRPHHVVMHSPPAALSTAAHALEKFYLLSPGLASAVLQQGSGAAVEVPFRVTAEEAVVVLKDATASLLVLGRSGTVRAAARLHDPRSLEPAHQDRSRTRFS